MPLTEGPDAGLIAGLPPAPHCAERSGADFWGQVAQLVKQRIENPRVGGSIPPLATIFSGC